MRRVAGILLLAAACGFLWPQGRAQASDITILLAWPTEGHNGDTFYLSGHGYLPRTQLTFLVACPNFFHANNGNWELYDGPTTNNHGDFAGYPIVGFRLQHGVTSSPCTVYANYALQGPTQNGGGTIAVCKHCALYNITDKPLRARDRFITGKARATPQQIHAGLNEMIQVTGGWGGATAQVVVRFPHERRHATTAFHLDWSGQGEGKLLIDGSLARQPGLASVSVAFSLGDKHGKASTSFTVLR